MTEVDFYCTKCELDQRLKAVKLDNDIPCYDAEFNFKGWKKNTYLREWFSAKCSKCKKELIRFITDAERDPYYYQSKNVIINRNKFSKDLVQPGDVGFKILYHDEWLKIEKAREEAELKKIAEKKDRDKFYKEHSSNINDKEFAKKIISIEEKLSQ